MPPTLRPSSSPKATPGPGSAPAPLFSTARFGAEDHDPGVNMTHLELFDHFSFETVFPEFDADMRDYITTLGAEASFANPYLMHELLAISARHLSVLRPHRAHFYLQHAVELQTHALSLFNAAKPCPEPSTSVAIVLFSGLLGRHLLADVLLSIKKMMDFDTFLDRYLHCLQIHRGVRIVITGDWTMIRESPLGRLTDWAMDILKVQKSGRETQCIRQLLLSSSSNLDAVSLRACEEAIEYLQVGLEEPRDSRKGPRVHMTFSWYLMVPEAFVVLLQKQVPEAIAILGWYAVLLHYGRNIWLIGDAGAHLFRLVDEYLGSKWDEWLAWPRQAISEV